MEEYNADRFETNRTILWLEHSRHATLKLEKKIQENTV